MARNTQYILCQNCGRDRPAYRFKKEMWVSESPWCQDCTRTGVTRGRKPFESMAHLKTRSCLRCDRKFKSLNDYRICFTCKRRGIWTDGEIGRYESHA